jgi:hypothetical protein
VFTWATNGVKLGWQHVSFVQITGFASAGIDPKAFLAHMIIFHAADACAPTANYGPAVDGLIAAFLVCSRVVVSKHDTN